jgi:hypothetical protein
VLVRSERLKQSGGDIGPLDDITKNKKLQTGEDNAPVKGDRFPTRISTLQSEMVQPEIVPQFSQPLFAHSVVNRGVLEDTYHSIRVLCKTY